ncbi:MAG: thioesterase family protein [Verrucomicrobiota bacterium]
MPVDESGTFSEEIVVGPDAIDRNDHVNNVVYVQWMQDVAIAHARSTGGAQETDRLGATWVARSHHIEYRRPALLGDRLIAKTWIAEVERVRSKRRYQFLKADDQSVIAHGETDWVYIDANSGRPLAIPDSVRACFTVVAPKTANSSNA